MDVSGTSHLHHFEDVLYIMEATDLLGFKVKYANPDLFLTKVVSKAMQYAHVTYMNKGECEASGYFFTHPDTVKALTALTSGQEEVFIDSIKLDFFPDPKPISSMALTELNKSKAFPMAKLSCGIFIRKTVFLETWPRRAAEVCSPVLNLDEKRKEISVKFAQIGDGGTPYLRKIVFKSKDLDQSLGRVIRTGSRIIIYFPLVRSPKTCDSTANQKQNYWLCNGTKDPWVMSTGCVYEGRDQLWEFLANLTVIRMEFDCSYRMNQGLITCLQTLSVVSSDTRPIRDESVRNILPTVTMRDVEASGLSFKLKYLLFCLMSHGYTSCFHMDPLFLLKLKTLREEYVVRAFTRIYQSCKTFYAKPENFDLMFQTYYEEAERRKDAILFDAEDADQSTDSHILRRILVTPSTIYFTLPSRELSNRVTRYYIEHLDRFMRLSFVDERLANLSSPSYAVQMRISNKFLPHFRFFERDYELLSFSSSQLRAGSLWMFSNLPDLTVTDIRNWLGDFRSIKNPAKYSARVGQCFSNSKHTIMLLDSELENMPDITVTTNNKVYVMSDGAGTISPELASRAGIECQWDLSYGSAIQIRLGGIKGVVSIDPELTGSKLKYRDSMYKFPSTHRGLEILNFAQFRYGYLNRQIILLMSTLGVKDAVFRQLQNEYLTSMKEVFTNPAALRSKLMVTDCDEAGCPLMAEAIKEMIDAGLSPAQDPFLRTVAQALYNRMIMELRQKQRILVNKSACLMGVLDETGTLEYGQTYIRIKHSDQGDNEVDETIDGFVAVTKNPCFHPGDVRKLTAIKAPQLSHHINVIVFPSKGPRPHPNEISGSDLDGDLYFVTWESGLVRFEPVESMDFSVSRKAEEVDEMNSEMMKTFFLKFICSDNLGIIANAHLAIADDSPQKANDERCLKLAKMHSTAVDFAKTGVSDVIPKELKPKRYPDFMENKTKEQYGSTKVIGVLYRQAKDFKYQLEDFVSEELQEPHPDLRTAADDLYQLYQSELQGVMNIFNIQTEVEVLTGEVAKYSKFYNNNQKKRREETRTKLKNIVEKLTKGMTDRFLEKATDRIMDLALECRYIAYTDPTHKYPGFPWVVAHTHLLRS